MFPRCSATIRPCNKPRGGGGEKVFRNWKLLPFRALHLIGDWMGTADPIFRCETTVLAIKFLVHRGIIFVHHSDKVNYVFEEIGRSRENIYPFLFYKNLLDAKERNLRRDMYAPFSGQVVLFSLDLSLRSFHIFPWLNTENGSMNEESVFLSFESQIMSFRIDHYGVSVKILIFFSYA